MKIVEFSQDVVHGKIIIEHQEIEFMANVVWDHRTLHLSQLHVYGGGPNTLGLRRLNAAIQELLVQLDLDTLEIEGGQPVTGSATGPAGTGPRTPRKHTFHRKP